MGRCKLGSFSNSLTDDLEEMVRRENGASMLAANQVPPSLVHSLASMTDNLSVIVHWP